MPVWARLSTVRFVAVAMLAASASGTEAQELLPAPAQKIHVTPHHAARLSRTPHRQNASSAPQIAYRGLTVNRLSEGPDDGDNVLVDGPIRYGDIHGFSPFPYATSGQQFPYGFDGIGGYGSELGIGAGQNASIYDRGP